MGLWRGVGFRGSGRALEGCVQALEVGFRGSGWALDVEL